MQLCICYIWAVNINKLTHIASMFFYQISHWSNHCLIRSVVDPWYVGCWTLNRSQQWIICTPLPVSALLPVCLQEKRGAMHAAGHQLLLTCLETLQRALKGRTAHFPGERDRVSPGSFHASWGWWGRTFLPNAIKVSLTLSGVQHPLCAFYIPSKMYCIKLGNGRSPLCPLFNTSVHFDLSSFIYL